MNYYQFIILAEAYKAPNWDKYDKQAQRHLLKGNRERAHKMWNQAGKVKRGADNPEWDTTEHPDYEIKKTGNFDLHGHDGELTYHHKPSGITFSVYGKDKERDGSTSYGIAWKHNQQPKTHKEKIKLINAARKVGKDVLSRAPHNAVLWNSPDPNANTVNPISGREKKTSGNVRSGEYGNYGMGPLNPRTGIQIARVGRPPSSRQKAKNKYATNLRPMEDFS